MANSALTPRLNAMEDPSGGPIIASDSQAGAVSTEAQTFAGAKTFNNSATFASGQTITKNSGLKFAGPDLNDTVSAAQWLSVKAGGSPITTQIGLANINGGTNSQIVCVLKIHRAEDPNVAGGGTGIVWAWARVHRTAGAGASSTGSNVIQTIEGTVPTVTIYMVNTATNEWRVELVTPAYHLDFVEIVVMGRTNSGLWTWLI